MRYAHLENNWKALAFYSGFRNFDNFRITPKNKKPNSRRCYVGFILVFGVIGSRRPRNPKKSIKSHVFYVRMFLENKTCGVTPKAVIKVRGKSIKIL